MYWQNDSCILSSTSCEYIYLSATRTFTNQTKNYTKAQYNPIMKEDLSPILLNGKN